MALDGQGRPIPVSTPPRRKFKPGPDRFAAVKAELDALKARVEALEKKNVQPVSSV